jgi:nicotinamidase-related amidase
MKNRFTTTNAAMVLIDHQAGTINLARNIPRAEIVRNMRALARTAVENGMPLVLTTSLETEFQGPMLDDLKAIAPEAYNKRVRRHGVVDCWDDENFKNAVVATGRKKSIMAGLTNHVCTVFPSISATEDGYDVQVVVDAGGSPTQVADDLSVQRMKDHGVKVTVTDQMLAELAGFWNEGAGPSISKILQEEILSATLRGGTSSAPAA